MIKIAIIVTKIDKYRIEFYQMLSKSFNIVTFQKKEDAVTQGFFITNQMPNIQLKSIFIGRFLIYNIMPFINRKYKYIVVLGNVWHISTWILLFIGRITGVKLIVWGHGISMKRYIAESNNLPWIRICMYKLAYGAWFYTEMELNIYKKKMSRLIGVSLNNTISEVAKIVGLDVFSNVDKKYLKNKYQINTKYNLIICTRFESTMRKSNELLHVVKNISKDWGLIIIGDGKLKPDFTKVKNVYDFGSVYDRKIKTDLFLIADLYIQLGHIGLSIVEAFAYKLPIITLKRSETIHHSMEYNYIINQKNGFICENVLEVIDKINLLDKELLSKMGKNAFEFVCNNLSMNNMCEKAISLMK